jgi:hypothetical protein
MNLALRFILTTLHFLCNFIIDPKACVLHNTRLLRLARDKHTTFLCPFIIYKKMKCCDYSPLDHIQKTSFSSELFNELNKLERYNILGLKGFPWTNTLPYCEPSKVTKMKYREYSFRGRINNNLISS